MFDLNVLTSRGLAPKQKEATSCSVCMERKI